MLCHVEQQQQPWASRNFGAAAAAAAAPAATAAEGPSVFSIAMMTELQSQEARRQELTPKAQRVPRRQEGVAPVMLLRLRENLARRANSASKPSSIRPT